MVEVLIASTNAVLRRRLIQRFGRDPTLGRIHQAGDRPTLEDSIIALKSPTLLLDLPMTGFDGLQCLQVVRTLNSGVRTILLVDSPDESTALQALREGAKGYCSKESDPELLLRAIRLVAEGEVWLGRKVVQQLIEKFAIRDASAAKVEERLRFLTRREREIGRLVADGASNKEIGYKLSITERTIKAHLTNIYRKLGCSSRLQLAIHALSD